MKKLTNRQKQAINTKLKITGIAIELFRKKNYENVTIKDICEASGISIGAFYHHFKSKEDIISTGQQQVDILLEEKVQELNFNSPREEVLYVLREAGAVFESLGWTFVAQTYRQMLVSEEKYMLKQDRFVYIRLNTAIERGIKVYELKEETDAAELTATLLRIVRGVVFDWCLMQGEYDLKERIYLDTKFILEHYSKNKL